MSTRIYAVQSGDIFKLVEASNKNAALRYVAKDLLSVYVADQRTLVAAMQDGVKVEVVGKDSDRAE